MNDCKLKSLENFPQLRKLIVLELSDNEYAIIYIDWQETISINLLLHLR